jgi:hypothetical protein
MNTIDFPTSIERDDPEKSIPVNLRTIAGLIAMYHRDNMPIIPERTEK